MNIALDATYAIGDSLTGVGVYSNEILYGLARAHSEVHFRFCYRSHRYLRSWRISLPPNCRRSLIHEPWLLPLSADLFHGLNQRMPAHRFRRSVSTFHDLFVMTGEYSTPEFRERFTQLSREAAQRSDVIIAVSQFTANQVHELLGVEKNRIRVIHHGVRVSTGPAAIREKMILHVGAIQTRKNIHRLVEAFAAAPDNWRLVLAGSTGFGAQQAMEEIERSRARSRIHVTGYASSQELQRLYQTAAVFAFPSLDEGFGMPVLEAMANRIPVVSSNRSALPEVCGDAAFLIDPLDVGALAAAIRLFTTDDQLRAEYAAKGWERAKLFSWEAALTKTWEVYRDLLN